jgi:L-lactate dehydrogenase
MSGASVRVEAARLRDWAAEALRGEGLAEGLATDVAEVLVEGDLLGHGTHGTALLPRYVEEIRAGRMTREGEPAVLRDAGGAASWDGRYLPGPALVRRAFARCEARARETGVASVAIGRSHHIACLAAYLRPVAEAGLLGLLATSSPATRSVAPFGAVQGVYSPNPIAAAWPTEGEPVLLDISTSITTNSLAAERSASGERLPRPWMVDADGEPSDDPTLLGAEPPGALLPVGGLNHGHKGFALGLLVEALTSGPAGHGRADEPGRWGASVLVLVLAPARHGGSSAFRREAEGLAGACRSASVPDGCPSVRLPGERALRRRREQMASGVTLSADAVERLARATPVPFPAALVGLTRP